MNVALKTCIALLFLSSSAFIFAQESIPSGWDKSGSDKKNYRVQVDTEVKFDGNRSVSIESLPEAKSGFVTLIQSLDAEDYTNQRIMLKVALKTQNVIGSAGAWLRVDDAQKMISMDNMSARPIVGTNDWQEYNLVLDVPYTATKLHYGVIFQGKGKVWADSFSIKEVDLNTPVTATLYGTHRPRNLDFENEE
jgi:hypothetical protein